MRSKRDKQNDIIIYLTMIIAVCLSFASVCHWATKFSNNENLVLYISILISTAISCLILDAAYALYIVMKLFTRHFFSDNDFSIDKKEKPNQKRSVIKANIFSNPINSKRYPLMYCNIENSSSKWLERFSYLWKSNKWSKNPKPRYVINYEAIREKEELEWLDTQENCYSKTAENIKNSSYFQTIIEKIKDLFSGSNKVRANYTNNENKKLVKRSNRNGVKHWYRDTLQELSIKSNPVVLTHSHNASIVTEPDIYSEDDNSFLSSQNISAKAMLTSSEDELANEKKGKQSNLKISNKFNNGIQYADINLQKRNSIQKTRKSIPHIID